MDTTHRILIATPVACSLLSLSLYLPTLPKNPDAEGGIRLHDDARYGSHPGRIFLPDDDNAGDLDAQAPLEFVDEKQIDYASTDGRPVKGGGDRFWKAVRRLNFDLVRVASADLAHYADDSIEMVLSRLTHGSCIGKSVGSRLLSGFLSGKRMVNVISSRLVCCDARLSDFVGRTTPLTNQRSSTLGHDRAYSQYSVGYLAVPSDLRDAAG